MTLTILMTVIQHINYNSKFLLAVSPSNQQKADLNCKLSQFGSGYSLECRLQPFHLFGDEYIAGAPQNSNKAN